MSNSVGVECIIMSIQLLVAAVKEAGLAIDDLQAAKREMRELEDCAGKRVLVDYVITNETGDKIGVRTGAEGKVELVSAHPQRPSVKSTVDRVTQAYARLKVLDEVKRKGYKSVKEERLANGSIRLVVEKWR